MSPEKQQEIGHRLFNIWLSDHWKAIQEKIPPDDLVQINITSEAPEILNLPWELITPRGENHLGTEPRYSIRRYPKKSSITSKADLPSGPLRILFMACAPRDEEYMQNAIQGLDAAFDSGDLGTFDELDQRIGEFRPHIVHLTGHGVVGPDQKGYFAFEDDRGDLDDSNRITDKGTAEFYKLLLSNLAGESRVVITRYLPSDVSPLLKMVYECQLGTSAWQMLQKSFVLILGSKI